MITNEQLEQKLIDSIERIEGLCEGQTEPAVNLYAERALREAVRDVIKIRQESKAVESNPTQITVTIEELKPNENNSSS